MANTLLMLVLVLSSVRLHVASECSMQDRECVFRFEIDQKLTMMHGRDLVYSSNGKLYRYDVTNTSIATPIPENEVIIGDGWAEPRLVEVVNGQFPGPEIIVYEGQKVIVYVKNCMFSQTASIHWHGLPQAGTPWMDGVPWVTQCPIQPGSTFRYEFIARPRGTFWWHSHSGVERSMGLFGAFIVKDRKESNVEEHIMQIQDWNHGWDSYLNINKMKTGHFVGRESWRGVMSFDNHYPSKAWIDSGLINGRGRYYDPDTGIGNETPLTLYRVKSGQKYRFRVIGTGSTYLFRISVDNHKLKIVASDGHDLEPVIAESFIINPGERFDFEITADQNVGNYWVRGETLERNPRRVDAILRYDGAPEEEPSSERQTCTASDPCLVVNCPIANYPMEHTTCLTFGELKALTTDDPAPPCQSSRFKEFFLNFGFPGIKKRTPAINGRKFHMPNVNALTQPKEWQSSCDAPACGEDRQCTCTHAICIGNGDTIQMVFTNMGHGKGFSHPIHMHGHSFYVIKMGYVQNNTTTNALVEDHPDVDCRGDPAFNYCNNATWADPSWLHGNVPDMELARPPRKDTIVVPVGGYVVVRIRADNPGLWSLHCHTESHNVAGMRMLLNESFTEVPAPPNGFPVCHPYPPHPYRMGQTLSDDPVLQGDDVGQWSSWTDCSASCGSGINFRFRTCSPGYTCSRTTTDSRPCLLQECERNQHGDDAGMTSTNTTPDDDTANLLDVKVFWVVLAVLAAIIVLQLFALVCIVGRRAGNDPGVTGGSPSEYRSRSLQGLSNNSFDCSVPGDKI